MRKIQFCAGSRTMAGWECHDMDMDIRKPLPIPSETVGRIHVEHGLEHVSHQEAWKFLEECHRILCSGGLIRIAIPDITKMWMLMECGLGKCYVKAASDGHTKESAIKASVFNHGHQASWNTPLLEVFLACVGFHDIKNFEVGESDDIHFVGIEQHGTVVGDDVNCIETSVVQAAK
jgi:hypothetical protein